MALATKDLRELSVAELEKKLRDIREEASKIRIEKQTGRLEQTHRIREIRRDIARIETILNQKNAAAATQA